MYPFLFLAIIFLGLGLFLLQNYVLNKKGNWVNAKNFKVIIKKTIKNVRLKNEIWKIYNKTFNRVNKDAPCQQSIANKKDFFLEMEKQTIVKYLLFTQKKELAGVGLITRSLKDCTWISHLFFQKYYSEYYDRERIFYFMGIAIKDKYQGMKLSGQILQAISSSISGDFLIGFDHSQKINPFIPTLIKFVKLKNKVVQSTLLDKQVYHLIKIKDKK